jgi:hypothetical protein
MAFVRLERDTPALITSAPAPPCRYYSLFTLFMLVTFESTVVGQRLRNLNEIRSLQKPKQVGLLRSPCCAVLCSQRVVGAQALFALLPMAGMDSWLLAAGC